MKFLAFLDGYLTPRAEASSDAARLRDVQTPLPTRCSSLSGWRFYENPTLLRLVQEMLRDTAPQMKGPLTLPDLSDPVKVRAALTVVARERHADKLKFVSALEEHRALLQTLSASPQLAPDRTISLPALIEAVAARCLRGHDPLLAPDTLLNIARRDLKKNLRQIGELLNSVKKAALANGVTPAQATTHLLPVMRLARWAFDRWVEPRRIAALPSPKPKGKTKLPLDVQLKVEIDRGSRFCGLNSPFVQPPSASEILQLLDRLETISLGGLRSLGSRHGLLGRSTGAVNTQVDVVARSVGEVSAPDQLGWQQVLSRLQTVESGLKDDSARSRTLEALSYEDLLAVITLALRLALGLYYAPNGPTVDHIKLWQSVGKTTLQVLGEWWVVEPPPPPEIDVLEVLDLSPAGWQDLVSSAPLGMTQVDPLTWMLFNLRLLGQEIENGERAPWRHRSVAYDPPNDVEAQHTWEALTNVRDASTAGSPPILPLDSIKRLFWQQPARPVVLSHLSHVRVRAALSRSGEWSESDWSAGSGASRAAALARGTQLGRGLGDKMEELEHFFPLLMLGDSGCTPPWVEITARALEELGDDGPISAIANLLQSEQWAKLLLFAERTPRHSALLTQVRMLWEEDMEPISASWFALDPRRLEQLLDVVVIAAVQRRWRALTQPDLKSAIRTMRHQRHRARGRLRALVFAGDLRLVLPSLCSAPGLHARLSRALGWYMLRWVECEIEVGLPITYHTITPPCTIPAAPKPRADTPLLDVDDTPTRNSLRYFVLICLIRGVYDTMVAWAQPNGGESYKGTLGALIQALPSGLADVASIVRSGPLQIDPNTPDDPLELQRGLLDETARLASCSPDAEVSAGGRRVLEILQGQEPLRSLLPAELVTTIKDMELPARRFASFGELREALLLEYDELYLPEFDAEEASTPATWTNSLRPSSLQADATFTAMRINIMKIYRGLTQPSRSDPCKRSGQAKQALRTRRVTKAPRTNRTWTRLRATLQTHHEPLLAELGPLLEQIIEIPGRCADKPARASALETLVQRLGPPPPLAFGEVLLPPSKVDRVIQLVKIKLDGNTSKEG